MDNQSEEKSKFLSAKEVSEYLSIPLRTIQRLSKEGRIKAIRIGNNWKYRKEDVDYYRDYGTDFSREPARKSNEFIERRAHSRINCRIDCRYSISITNLSGSGVVKNISAGGIFLAGNGGLIEIGDPIDLRFMLNDQVALNGRVVRKDSAGFGIKFRNISNEYKKRIIEYVG